MALKEQSSLKLGVRPSFCFINSNSSAVILNCSAVVTVISINVVEENVRKCKGNDARVYSGRAIVNILTIFPH